MSYRTARVTRLSSLLVLAGLVLTWPAGAGAQTPAQAPAPAAAAPSPRQLFDQRCLTCHGRTDVPRAADPAVLRRMTPEHVYAALTTGVMQTQAEGLSDADRRAIAEYLGDRKLGAGPAGDVASMANHCSTNPPIGDLTTSPMWNMRSSPCLT